MKFKLFTPIVLLSVSFLVGTTPLHAQDEPPPPPSEDADNSCPKDGPRRGDFRKKTFERFDTNKDGKLDDAEKAAMKEEMKKRPRKGPWPHRRGECPNGQQPPEGSE